MANLILRPTADGQYTTWDGFSPGPHTPLYDLIDEADYVVGTGDDEYVSTSDPGSTFSVLLQTATAGSWPRATRIVSIRVVAVVRQLGAGSDFRFRLRSLGRDLDSPITTLTATSYTEVGHTFNLGHNQYAWDLSTVNRLEAGLVFSSGDELRCTKLEVYLHYEPYPHYTLVPDADGVLQTWTPVPSGSPAYMTVSGVYDGDLSYIQDQVVNNQSVFSAVDLPAVIAPANIDMVRTKALVKNVGVVEEVADSILWSGLVYHGGTSTTGIVIPPDREWYLLTEDYLNDPNVAWPSGDPAATAWTIAEVNDLQVGVENSGGGDFRTTAVALEVWLAATPAYTVDLFPTADGYHQDQSSVVGAATAWQATSEDPPDDITSYIVLDADTLGISAYTSFTVGGVGAVPAGERVHGVELRCRIRLDNLPHSEALVAPVIRNTASVPPETYVGRPQLIEGMAGTWFDVRWDFGTDPHDGLPWVDVADVTTNLEYGFVVLEGAVLLSRLRVQVQTAVDYRGVSGAVTAQLTNVAETYILRSRADGTIYGVTEFAVGTGGYAAAMPTTVVAVDPTAVALTNEIYRTGIERIEYDGTAANSPVDYWCRVPPGVAQGGVGEIALWAEIFWSPIPAEIGTSFLYGLAHMPCQTRHPDDAHFYKVRLAYWDFGAELLTDGDMELVGTASWTATASVLSKQLTNPYEGLQSLRSAQTGAPTGTASQAVLTLGTLYRFQVQARSDATTTPLIENPAGTAVWTGTTGTAWQAASLLHVAAGDTSFWLGASGGAATDYSEFDAASVREVLSYDFLTHGAELLVDGDAEAVGVAAWAIGNAATVTKEAGAAAGQGTQVLRVAHNGVANLYVLQTILVAGTIYRLQGWCRGDGVAVPTVLNPVYGTVWTGAATTAWEQFDLVWTAGAADIWFQSTIAAAGYCEWDNLTIRAISLP